MTRKEAIEVIKCLAWHTRPSEEEIEQAIKVLKKKPCKDAERRDYLLDDRLMLLFIAGIVWGVIVGIFF
jgi:F0F1-type ATP synthase assembly protein I